MIASFCVSIASQAPVSKSSRNKIHGCIVHDSTNTHFFLGDIFVILHDIWDNLTFVMNRSFECKGYRQSIYNHSLAFFKI